ncbi:MAG: oligosaccharide flippase family protein, partial [Candidatus Bathyarchaeia archaeon]
ERMDRRAAVNVFQGLIKGVSAPLLVYLGFGVSGAVIGIVLSYLFAAPVGLLLAFFSSPRRARVEMEPPDTWRSLRLMLAFGLPLFLGGLVAGFAGRLQGFLLSWFVSDELIGNYGVAFRFTSLVNLVTESIGVTLFPAFSRFSYVVEPEKLREAFQGSVRYSAIIVLPLVLLLATVAKPAIYTLFTSKYPYAPLFFQLLLAPMLLVGLGSLSIGNFLNSQGDTTTSMRITLLLSSVSILLSPILVWVWGVIGLVASIIVSGLAGNLLGFLVLRNKYRVSPELEHSGRTLLCSAVSAASAYGVLWFLSDPTPLLRLFIGTAIFLTAFLLLAPLMGAIEGRDIGNLDLMLRDLKIIYPFARILLDFEERLLLLTHGNSGKT